jgi:hypothetical protein
MNSVLSLSATASWWGARILSGLILLIWGFFLVAHAVGTAGSPSRPLVWNDYAILATLVVSLVGLALAWKWELPGAAITLVAIGACAALNWRVLLFPGTLILVAAVLFLSSWWASSTARHAAP